MKIILNGEKREVPDGLTILSLLQFLSIQPERVAVELNLNVVRKNDYDSTAVGEGDAVEVVSFMGGGLENKFKVKSAKFKMMVRSKIENG